MTSDEICKLLNEHKHDGETDWALAPDRGMYFSLQQSREPIHPFMPMSSASAEIIAKHYHAMEVLREFDEGCKLEK